MLRSKKLIKNIKTNKMTKEQIITKAENLFKIYIEGFFADSMRSYEDYVEAQENNREKFIMGAEWALGKQLINRSLTSEEIISLVEDMRTGLIVGGDIHEHINEFNKSVDQVAAKLKKAFGVKDDE